MRNNIRDFFIRGGRRGAIAYMREHREVQNIRPSYIGLFENILLNYRKTISALAAPNPKNTKTPRAPMRTGRCVILYGFYLAYSTARVSRTTWTLI